MKKHIWHWRRICFGIPAAVLLFLWGLIVNLPVALPVMVIGAWKLFVKVNLDYTSPLFPMNVSRRFSRWLASYDRDI